MKRNTIIAIGIILSSIILISIAGIVTRRQPKPQINHFAPQTQAADFSKPHDDIVIQQSPDGTKQLVLTIKHPTSEVNTYIFTTMDKDGKNKKEIYKITKAGETYTIPFNTWSPDNKYVFIQKESGEALVFSQNGETITPKEWFLDVKDVFSQTERNDRYKMVTGWASPTLLILNTTKESGTKGSSYWFEVPSKAIIQLWGDF